MKPTTSLDQRYRALLRSVADALKQHGFANYRAIVAERPDAVLVVQLQRSSRSDSECILFAVNVGIVSRILLPAEAAPVRQLEIEDCHWRERVHTPGPGAPAEWWRLDAGTDDHTLARSVVAQVRSASRRVDHLTAPQALRDLWLSERSPGLTDAERLMALVRLLTKIGPSDQLQAVGATLREAALGQPFWPTARGVLREAGIATP